MPRRHPTSLRLWMSSRVMSSVALPRGAYQIANYPENGTKKPNARATEVSNPRYILSIIHISRQTVDQVNSLPVLKSDRTIQDKKFGAFMHHRYMSPRAFKVVVIFWIVVFLLGAGLMAVKYNSSLPKPGDRLVEGRIIKMEVQETTSSGFRSSRRIVSHDTFLTIKIVNTNTVVTALLNGDWTGRLPDVVTFYYSGDPTQRVYLQPDNSSLMGAVLSVIMALTAILGLIVVLMLYKRAERFSHDQHQALLEKIDRS